METVRFRYGDHASQVVDLHRSREAVRSPVCVLIHGGFWRQRYGLDLMGAIIPSLVDEGWAVWNIEYRRVGGCGGWPTTFDDVAAAVDLLSSCGESLDLARVAVVGHSAGGHLALWAASRATVSPNLPGADPRVLPSLVISVAGMGDLTAALPLGGEAVLNLMGAGSDEAPIPWAVASPAERLPLGVRQVLIHGSEDFVVPVEQSVRYAARAADAGDDVMVELIEGEDHFAVLDPASQTWAAVLSHLRPLAQGDRR